MTSTKSSFSAFNEVDESVAKPVLGSDGAARWQDFKSKSKLDTKFSVAPAMPLKKLDRALGTKSIRDEQANEAKIRREAGDREAGAGYLVFKRKTDAEEVAERKRAKLVMDRVRPDDVPYFLEAASFEGYKFDYVFTTRDTRGTGYYWDGMDSLRKELGQPPTYTSTESGNDDEIATKNKPKKKKKKIREPESTPESDEFNPMEQVAQAMLRRMQAMGGPPSSLLGVANRLADAAALGADSSELELVANKAHQSLEPELIAAGWETAKDPNSGKIYYFRRSTNERSWRKPDPPKTNYSEQLPDGWRSAKDQSSGKVYYYHMSGKTSWDKPIKKS
ncbi:hypothetical protein ACHAXA_002047 [Cyclostephanos tholiformis]|jgi:hypothetical protein|uniref:WW domain-containing protein n=1 Tax=Cyclostephanos tholiformis TaxID=382380 RepID=A0ABD3ST08_9STRA